MALLPLIGRAHEKAWLQRELAGERPVVLLTGEPGIGKTRLLYETMDWAERLGWQVLSGGCQRNSGQEPYAPLVEALQRSIRGLQPKRLRAGLQGCAWLARLLPELTYAHEGGEGVLASPDALPPDQEQRLMFAAIERYLSNSAGRAGTLLVLDDLQWASADALHLLTHLVRSTGARHIRLLGAYRSTDVAPGHRLSTLVADLAREDLVRQLELPPLATEEATALASALLEGSPQASADEESDVLIARVVERAAGVPFFLVSYARWVQAQGQPLQWDAARRVTGGKSLVHTSGLLGAERAEIPWDVTQSIRERVAALPATAQDLLGAAAVVGQWAPGVLLAEAAGQSEVEALTGLEMACQVGLLVEEREERGPEGYRFVHDVIRDVVEASIGAWRQKVLHRQIAAALERGLLHSTGPIGSRQGEDRSLAQLAYHYMRADVPEKAALYLRQAGDHARGVFAHREAAAYYRELTQCLDRLGSDHEAAQARRDLALELARVGCFGEAVASLEEAEQICRAIGDVEMLALVTVDIGNLRAAQGASEEGLARVQPLVAVLTNEIAGTSRADTPPVSPAVAAQLHGAVSSLSFMVGRYRDALQTAERAVDVARSTGDGGLLAREQLVLGVALFTHGRLDEAIEQLEQAIVGADAVGDLEVLAEALRMASWTYQTRGAFPQSQAAQERALAV
ncbi:MAG TPA: AAA family ATPase, partial [Ktedonobacterales bacterium]|nr:AAA family ATPase [Ktedonobacterales bacterium]